MDISENDLVSREEEMLIENFIVYNEFEFEKGSNYG